MSYAAQAATARRMIGAKGKSTTFRRVTTGAYNPETGVQGASTTAFQSVLVVTLPVAPGRDDTLEQGAFRRQHQRKLLMALPTGATLEPTEGDQIYLEGSWWTLPGVSTLRPDGTDAILYEATVQRGA